MQQPKKQLHCERCGHNWPMKKVGSLPLRCPLCTSVKWNVPKE